jgi:hypothetical protein
MKTLLLIGLLFPSVILGEIIKSDWSPYKEGMRVRIESDDKGTNGSFKRIIAYVEQGPAYKRDIVKPPVVHMLKCKLYDEHQKEVPQTLKGKRQGSKLETKLSRKHRIAGQIRWPWDEPIQIGFLDLHELFKIPKAGDYEIEMTVRLLQEKGKDLTPVFFPPVKLRIHLQPAS